MVIISTILSVENLTKIYGREIIVGPRTLGRKVVGAQDVSFDIKKGEIFGFLGPNGAGKTTTIRAVLDYLKIQNGKISVFGLPHDEEALTIRERIGYVPGDLALYENFTGNELLEYYSKYRPMNKEFMQDYSEYC